MIIDIEEILINLPAEPKHALLEIGQRLKDIKGISNNNEELLTNLHTANKIISSWCDKNTIAIDKTTFTNPVKQHTHYMEQLDRVRVYIMENVVDQKVEEAIRGDLLSFGCAKLDRTEKENIHSSLQKIRQIIEQSQLPDKKRMHFSKNLTPWQRKWIA